jgi:hypothetical protein
MKFTKVTIVLLVLSFFAVNTLNSQVKTKSKNWKSPTFTIDIVGNYSIPLQEAKGENIGEFFKFMNYGTKYGWGASFNFKFGLGPQGQYRPYVSLGYTQLQSSDDQNAYINTNWINNGYPLKNNEVFGTPVAGQSEMFLRIPHIGAGFEYAITNVDKKKRMWYPFFGVEFLMSVITGVYRQTSNNVPIQAGVETAFNIKTDVRMGIGAGLGATIRLGKSAGITFGSKYKLANLIGKTSDFLQEENKMNLLDKAATELNSNLSKDRNIGFIELYLGATIFLGKTKK